jgi:hypothetical protein
MKPELKPGDKILFETGYKTRVRAEVICCTEKAIVVKDLSTGIENNISRRQVTHRIVKKPKRVAREWHITAGLDAHRIDHCCGLKADACVPVREILKK